YSLEGKHIFIDVNQPTRAMDLHAGSKDVAEEIFQALGELKGASKGEGLREVFAAADQGSKRRQEGTILWDFAASEKGELSVTAGDTVEILDDTEPEWWLVRRIVNG